MTFSLDVGQAIEIVLILVGLITFVVKTRTITTTLEATVKTLTKDLKAHEEREEEKLEKLKIENAAAHEDIVQIIQKACNGGKVIIGPGGGH